MSADHRHEYPAPPREQAPTPSELDRAIAEGRKRSYEDVVAWSKLGTMTKGRIAEMCEARIANPEIAKEWDDKYANLLPTESDGGEVTTPPKDAGAEEQFDTVDLEFVAFVLHNAGARAGNDDAKSILRHYKNKIAAARLDGARETLVTMKREYPTDGPDRAYIVSWFDRHIAELEGRNE